MRTDVSYTFHTRLGKGGFGEVYLATQQRPGGLRRQVAVKLLKNDIGNHSEAVKRLLDEGAMLAMLRHPCIVGVHELTRVEGRLALITEFVDGIDVSTRCSPETLMPERVTWEIGAEVASALDCAWNTISEETGKPLHLIHRDIKPENIRLGRHGEVKLLDFGIARSTEIARQAETAAGQLPFTPGYVPPEVFLRGEVNETTDIYALGCTLYRLLCGTKLYGGMNLAQTVQLAVIREDYLRWLDKRLSEPEMANGRELLGWMLAYDPAGRPSAAEAAHACEELADALPGATKRRWARDQSFGRPAESAGQLAGRTVHEPTLSVAAPDSGELQRLQEAAAASARKARVPEPASGDHPAPEFLNPPPALDDEPTVRDPEPPRHDEPTRHLQGPGLHGPAEPTPLLPPRGLQPLQPLQADFDSAGADADEPTIIDSRRAALTRGLHAGEDVDERIPASMLPTPPLPERRGGRSGQHAAAAPLPEPSPVKPRPAPSKPPKPAPTLAVWQVATLVIATGFVALLAGWIAFTLAS